MCDGGREKSVAIVWGGGGVEIVGDPRCNKRILLQEIIKDCVNKAGPADCFDLTSRDGY